MLLNLNPLSTLFLAPLLVRHIYAAPTTSPSPSPEKISEFDEPTLKSGSALPIPYDNLLFSGLTVRPDAITTLLKSRSPPNAIKGNQLDLTSGAAPPPIFISSQYSNSSSKIKYFSLKSLYFGCTLATTGIVGGLPVLPPGQPIPPLGAPLKCDVQFSGVDKDGKAIPAETCSFAGGLGAVLKQCVFSDRFKAAVRVDVGVLGIEAVRKVTVLVLDNVDHVNWS